MIWPKTVLNKLETTFFIWLTGYNRTGKTALAVDLSEYYLRDNFRLLSNLQCVWNDEIPMQLDSNGQLNCIVILDEGGVYMRSKESIRRVMGFKGKLNSMFLMPSSEAPHEDLWRNYIEPAERINEMVIIPLFGRWFYENICKAWFFCTFDISKGTKKSLFFQFFPKKVYYLYKTVISGVDPETILQNFDDALEAQQRFFGNSDPLRLQDLVTKRTGLGETSSFSNQQVTLYSQSSESKRNLLPPKKG